MRHRKSIFWSTLAAPILFLPMTAHAQAVRSGTPSTSVRPSDSHRIRSTITGLLGWRVGVETQTFGQSNFWDAAAKADAAGAPNIQGSSMQTVSADIPKRLDASLTADEIAKVKNRLSELRLRMPAYRIDSLPFGDAALRKLFEFAKALGIETIITSADPASLDKFATEFGIKVAFDAKEPKVALAAVQGRGKQMGVHARMAVWSKNDLPAAKDRLFSVGLHGTAGYTAAFLLELSRLQPPPAPEWPAKCTNCAGPRVETRPVFLAVDPAADPARALAAFEKAVLPAMGYRVDEIARKTPITSTEKIPPAERQAIEAAVPRQPAVKPKKVRKLLVMDLCPQGGYYHATIAHANLALQLMAQTGAYEPIFSNDMENLKYPRIKQWDAVFLNSVVGELFNDPEVLSGLLRFVREGGGLAGIHGSTYASMDLPEFGDLIGAQDGPHQVETATLKIDDPASPLTKAFHGKGFVREDEFYHFLPTGPYSREKLHVLISIDTDKSDMTRWKGVRPDNDYGLVWIKSYGKGRVFNCAMGHTPTLFADPAMAQMVFSAIQFVLGDLDADTTPSARLTAKK